MSDEALAECISSKSIESKYSMLSELVKIYLRVYTRASQVRADYKLSMWCHRFLTPPFPNVKTHSPEEFKKLISKPGLAMQEDNLPNSWTAEEAEEA